MFHDAGSDNGQMIYMLAFSFNHTMQGGKKILPFQEKKKERHQLPSFNHTKAIRRKNTTHAAPSKILPIQREADDERDATGSSDPSCFLFFS